MQDERFRREAFGLHVGDHRLDQLVFGDRFAELDAGGGIGDAVGNQPLGRTDADARNVQPSAIEHTHRDLEAFALCTKHVFGRDRHIVEMHIADMRALLTHFLFRRTDAQAGRIGRDEEGRDASCARLAGARHDSEQMRAVGIGDVTLGAGQPPLIAVADGAGFDVGAVRPDIGLGQRKAGDDVPARDTGEPFGFLVGCARHDEAL